MVLFAAVSMAQDHEYLDLVLKDGSTLRDALVWPHHFDPQSTYPALLALPPGPQAEEMVENGLSRYWGRQASRRRWIVISPIAPGGHLFFQGSEEIIPQFLDALEKRFLLESNEFHLAGALPRFDRHARLSAQWT